MKISQGQAKKNNTEVADVFHFYGEQYRQQYPTTIEQKKVMRHIETCRTAALGGHMEVCDNCGVGKNAYNSCRDRHCPKCQTLAKEKWLMDRRSELLPCGYFHSVFTLPHDLNPLILVNMKIMLAILFTAVKETLQAFAKDPQWRLQGQLGFISVLHTWNQQLFDHFHLHCIIPAGALSVDKSKWISARGGYLFGVKPLAKEFKKRYLGKLKKAYDKGQLCFRGKNASAYADKECFLRLTKKLWAKQWITYSKQPFGGAEQVLEYLGRYTHRVAISNNRILSLKNGEVSFTYRDRADDNTIKEQIVKAEEFIRRFLLHVLPDGFMKIRYYGFLAHTNKKTSIPLLRQLIDPNAVFADKITETIDDMMLRLTGTDISTCTHCGKGKMIYAGLLAKPDIDTS